MTRRAIASITAGLVLLVGAPAAWLLGQPHETVGDLDAASTSLDDHPSPTPGTATTPTGTDAAPPADEPPAPRPAPAPEPDPVAAPTRISMPAIDVDAPVDGVGLEDDGTMEVPQDVHRIGWYDLGVGVGEPAGTAVLSGHVDSRSQGRGAFWDLRGADVDDSITIDHEDGTTTTWRVVARTVYPKDELPIADIFTRFGEPRLVLITCGGAFDNSTRHYEDNVVVYAEPVADPTP